MSHHQVPLCQVAEACGGCPLISLPAKEQRSHKLETVRGLLKPVVDLKFEFNEGIHFNSPPSPLAYRNRIRLRIDEEGQFGFFNPEKDPACAVLLPELKKTVGEISRRLDEVRDTVRLYDHVEIRTPDLDGQAGIFLSGQAAACLESAPRERMREVLASVACVGFAGDSSQPTQRYPLRPGVYQRVPLGGFMQVNFFINQQLIERVVTGAEARGLRSVLDLYCGAGNFLLPLLAAGFIGGGVEIHGQSILSAREAAREQDLSGEFHVADVPSWLLSAERQGILQNLDLAIVDPPRAGLGKGTEHLLKLSPRFIAVCSCSPSSLVRDLHALVEGGYAVESVELFDMFAHTHHVEVLVWLRRLA